MPSELLSKSPLEWSRPYLLRDSLVSASGAAFCYLIDLRRSDGLCVSGNWYDHQASSLQSATLGAFSRRSSAVWESLSLLSLPSRMLRARLRGQQVPLTVRERDSYRGDIDFPFKPSTPDGILSLAWSIGSSGPGDGRKHLEMLYLPDPPRKVTSAGSPQKLYAHCSLRSRRLAGFSPPKPTSLQPLAGGAHALATTH